jgi:hypothetical protein
VALRGTIFETAVFKVFSKNVNLGNVEGLL